MLFDNINTNLYWLTVLQQQQKHASLPLRACFTQVAALHLARHQAVSRPNTSNMKPTLPHARVCFPLHSGGGGTSTRRRCFPQGNELWRLFYNINTNWCLVSGLRQQHSKSDNSLSQGFCVTSLHLCNSGMRV